MNAALLRARLGIAGNPLMPVLLTRDKGKMRDQLRQAGIGSMRRAIAVDVSEVQQFGEQIHQLFGPADAAGALESIQSDAAISDAVKHDFPIYKKLKSRNEIAEKRLPLVIIGIMELSSCFARL